MPETLPASAPTPEEVAAAAEALRGGDLVAFPTETVYGLGADAANPAAVAKVFAAKGRPADHPLIVHLASADQLDDWAVDVPDAARRLADRFWPGPLTLILRRHPRVPTAVTGGQDTIGLRVPRHPVAHALLEAFGGGVAAPSANRFGRVSPTTRARVVAELGDVVGTVLEGGDCEVGLESTIVDLSGDRPRLLRPGGIGAAELAEVLHAAPTRAGTGAPRTPGRLPSHYAPTTPVRVVDGEALDAAVAAVSAAGRRCVALRLAVAQAEGSPADRAPTRAAPPADGSAADDAPDGLAAVLTLPAEAGAYGRALYGRLAEVDRLDGDVALVQRPPARPGWEAVHDRLGRAEGVDPHTPRSVLVVPPAVVTPTMDGVPTAPPVVAAAVRDAAGRTGGALLLGAWVGEPPPPVLPAVRDERPIHVGPPLASGPGWTLLRLDASDENLGIPVGRVELALALHAAGPGTFHPGGEDGVVLAAEADALAHRGVVVGRPLEEA
ncbi:MAG: threonylcarbamoyl-AMP synthase [Actinotalea sp.]|nr:threonylcarbamoyl-AMP synthase [Actinotalea sp.]